MSRTASAGRSGADPRRIGVLGAGGQLGRCLVRAIAAAPDLELAFAPRHAELDVADESAIAPWLDRPGAARPDLVVNAAAHTKVDACESERERAYAVNALGPAAWARTLAERGLRFVHVSTDYVFAGDGGRPYREDDATAPRTVYGASKRAGEVAVLGSHPGALVIRTSWVFGPGRNFVVAILDQALKRVRGEVDGPLRVVDDQRGCPTYAADLAEAILEIARREAAPTLPRHGLLHLCNADETTWFDFARTILEVAGLDTVAIEPVPTSAYPTPAPRPAYSVLDCSRAGAAGLALRPHREALAAYLAGPDRPEILQELPDAHAACESPR